MKFEERITRILEDKFMPIASKMADNVYLQSVRDGLVLGMPFLIIGSIFMIIAEFPSETYFNFMTNIFGNGWADKVLYPTRVSFDILAIFSSLGIAYRLAEKKGVDPISSAAISFVSFLMLSPNSISFISEAGAVLGNESAVPLTYLGSQGLFVAIFMAMLSTIVYEKIVKKGIVIKMPEGVPPAVSKSFVSLVPAFAMMMITWLIKMGFEATSLGTIHELFKMILGIPLGWVGGSLFGCMFAAFMISLLWCVGLHGADIVGAVLNPIWYVFMDQNRLAFTAGEALPNVMTPQFVDVFISIGGSGTTVVLAFLLFRKARSIQLKEIGKLSMAPALFNINEPIIFGTPIVMNPIMMIPFILAPVTVAAIAYIAIDIGLVAPLAGIPVPWTIPPVLGGYLATGGHISGAILQIVQIFVAGLIYFPFFKILDKKYAKEEGTIVE
ncbi:MAG: PTS cellobiose transporter subunit IIC [Erysipelotrichaceae bacterium]